LLDPKFIVLAAVVILVIAVLAWAYVRKRRSTRAIAADISVDHPRVVDNYRSAHEIALRVGNNGATTEDLRTAMIHYRSLFEDLVMVPTIVERKEVA